MDLVPIGQAKNPLNEKKVDISSPIIDEEVLKASDLAHLFIKTIKSFRLYPEGNPALLGIREQLFKSFQIYLELYGSFDLEIGESEFTFKGKILYEDRELKGSLPFLLFKDGLRELRFMEGLEEWELNGLTDIVVQRDDINEFEDDLLTLIWEKDFIHISYTAVDHFFEETQVPETVDQFRKSVRSEPMPASARGDFEKEGENLGFDYPLEIYENISEAGNAGNRSKIYRLTGEEEDALRKEVERELHPDFLFGVSDILVEILALEKGPGPYPDLVRVLQNLLETLLNAGEFQKAKHLLERLYAVRTAHSLQDGMVRAIDEFMESVGGPQQMQRIGAILEKGVNLRLEDVGAFLLLLKPNSIPGLIQILGNWTNSKGRRMICDVISELGKSCINVIGKCMNDPRWYLIRNLVYILGKIGQETSLPYIQKSYGHSEPRVRREAVQAAGLIGGTGAVALLTKALKDPDLHIRGMAAFTLARVAKESGLSALLEVIQSKDFSKRDSAEIKCFYDAVGSIRSNSALGPLQHILEQKGWFGARIKDEVRVGAACAIALVGTPEAKAILRSGADSRDESICRACREAKRRYGI